jgi:hypothetical protein
MCEPLARFLWRAMEPIVNPKAEASGDDAEVVWPVVKIFKWTGMNDYVALCEKDSVSFGGGYVMLYLLVWVFTNFVVKSIGKTVEQGCTCLRRSLKGAVRGV